VRIVASIPIDVEPCSLFFDRQAETLYLGDDRESRVLMWREGGGLEVVAQLPKTDVPRRLGQIVRTIEGDLLVPVFGKRSPGAIFRVSRNGAHAIADLDAKRQRLGLAIAGDGTIYETYFVDADGFCTGAVAEVGGVGGEQDLVAGLKEPAGIVALDDALFVADRARDRLVRIPRSHEAAIFTSFTAVPLPDAIALGPDGTLLVASRKNRIVIVGETGTTRDLVVGLHQPSGIAYDGDRRLYIADKSTDAPRIPHTLRIIELQLGAA
jgi:hypothetical protein